MEAHNTHVNCLRTDPLTAFDAELLKSSHAKKSLEDTKRNKWRKYGEEKKNQHKST